MIINDCKVYVREGYIGNTFVSLIYADPFTFVRGTAARILVIED